MNKTFEAIAKANADRYDEHPTLQNTIVIVGVMGVAVGLNALARVVAKKDIASRMNAGRYAK